MTSSKSVRFRWPLHEEREGFPHIVPHSAQQKPGLHGDSGCKTTRVLLRTEIPRQSHDDKVRGRDEGGEAQRGCAGVCAGGDKTCLISPSRDSHLRTRAGGPLLECSFPMPCTPRPHLQWLSIVPLAPVSTPLSYSKPKPLGCVHRRDTDLCTGSSQEKEPLGSRSHSPLFSYLR